MGRTTVPAPGWPAATTPPRGMFSASGMRKRPSSSAKVSKSS